MFIVRNVMYLIVFELKSSATLIKLTGLGLIRLKLSTISKPVSKMVPGYI